MVVCAGSIILLILGFLAVFAKDIIWELTVWQNQMKGLASERTDTWDTMTTIGGVISIILGLLAVYFFFQNVS